MSGGNKQSQAHPDGQDLKKIIADPDGTQTLVEWAEKIGKALAPKGKNDRDALTTSQIRALFGEVRRIQADWSIKRDQALHRLILLKPKMAYRARKERGRAVESLVKVLDPALDLVVEARTEQEQDARFQRFVEFFEAILAYHKAYGGQ
ncbi:MAG TPA: type III-A CRISPR-associated protein Csm2 [Thermoflexia bacterium]|jgi:CRISPR-associated protein Csm2|nr:type III-A CRISPR-associated protein Csm2 [Thermoflexia bacterium]